MDTEKGNDVHFQSVDEEDQEMLHFLKIVNVFKFYRLHSLRRIALAEKYFNELPQHHRALIPRFMEHLAIVRTCVDHNYEIIKLLIAETECMFENKPFSLCKKAGASPITEFEMDKLKSTLKQVMRDWSSEGQIERDACYKPVIDEVVRLFPEQHCKTNEVTVLVPGAGLGRLAYEIARHGYTCQGNEISLFMLFTSNFIINKCKVVNGLTLYPWVHQYCNLISNEDQVRPLHFPDVNPADLPANANFSMVAGDFLDVYTEPDSWDCVATVFFIDTAHNVIAYVEAIYKILKPGGYWINLGPLLYHFSDMANESSVELSYEDLKHVVRSFNFELIKEETGLSTSYTQNLHSMLKYEYDCVFFVARKTESNV